jgi:hypothetical protein
MPYRLGPCPDEAGHCPTYCSPAETVAGCGLASPDVSRRWLPIWLPANRSVASCQPTSVQADHQRAHRARSFGTDP